MAFAISLLERYRSIRSEAHSQLDQFTPGEGYSQAKTTDLQYDVTDQLANRFLETRDGRRLTSASVETYETQLREYIRFLSSRDEEILTADREDVIKFVELCVDKGNRTSTISGKLTVVSELYKFIFLRTDDREALSINPLELEIIDLSKYNTPPAIERDPLSREEIRLLFYAMDSYRNRLIVIVGIETGLRNSDIRNLRVKDVNLQKKSLYVRDPKYSRPYSVPISRELGAELEIWIDQFRTAYPEKETDYLFLSQHGGQLETNGGLNSIIKEAAEKAGIQETIGKSRISPEQKNFLNTDKEYREWKRVTAHTLRHTCLTLMKDEGVSLPYRQLVANHRDPATTQGYSHGREEEFREIRDQYNPPI